jgi:hypothetical protein
MLYVGNASGTLQPGSNDLLVHTVSALFGDLSFVSDYEVVCVEAPSEGAILTNLPFVARTVTESLASTSGIVFHTFTFAGGVRLTAGTAYNFMVSSYQSINRSIRQSFVFSNHHITSVCTHTIRHTIRA